LLWTGPRSGKGDIHQFKGGWHLWKREAEKVRSGKGEAEKVTSINSKADGTFAAAGHDATLQHKSK
jgi:hypothetical protein